MANTWLNGFNPQTRLGGLQGFVNALFDGETPNAAEDRALKAAQMRAQTRQFDASAGKLGSERALLDDRLGALQDPDSWVSAITGQPLDRVRAVKDYLSGNGDSRLDIPDWTTEDETAQPPVGSVGVDETGAPVMPVVQARVLPRKLTPEGALQARRIAEAIATHGMTRQTQPNNPNEVGKAFATGVNRLTTEQILGGLIAPEVGAARVAAADGKPMVDMNAAGQVINKFTGQPGPSNDLLVSSIAENNAQAGRYNADAAGDEFIDMIVGGRKVQVSRKDASRYAAEAAFRERQKAGGGAKEDKMVSVTLPNGQVIQVREADYSREVVKQLFPDPEKKKSMSAGDRRNAQMTVVGGLDAIEKSADGTFPPELRAQIVGRAMELAETPDYFANGAMAMEQAIAEIMPEGFTVAGEWNPLKDNIITPKGGARTPAPKAAPTTPAAPGYGARPDGTQKGDGFLGPMTNSRGETMTEFSVGVNIGGKEMDIPTMVPTLTRAEVDQLRNLGQGAPVPRSIIDKAVAHARQRIAQGKGVFAGPGESPGAKAPAADMSGKPAAKVARPKGATDTQLMQEANDAIKKGADRNKVIQRLRDMGVEVQ
jgi:hypothetical protein